MKVKVVISGSFTKHWSEVEEAIEQFKQRGAEVLAPTNGVPAREENGFIYLREDKGTVDELEWNHLRAIQQCDLLYCVNPGGYLGNSVAMEIGYALAWEIPVWTQEQFVGNPQKQMVQSTSIEEAMRSVSQPIGKRLLPESGDLDALQLYLKAVAPERHWHEETPSDVLILLVEEVGELAKAMRERLGLSVSDRHQSRKTLRLELADCFIYILHMANQTQTKLLSAFRQKERINASKGWGRWPKSR